MTRRREGAPVDALLVAAVVLLAITVYVLFKMLLNALDGRNDLPWLGVLLIMLPAAFLLGFVATVLRRRYRERIARLAHLRHLGRRNGQADDATVPGER